MLEKKIRAPPPSPKKPFYHYGHQDAERRQKLGTFRHTSMRQDFMPRTFSPTSRTEMLQHPSLFGRHRPGKQAKQGNWLRKQPPSQNMLWQTFLKRGRGKPLLLLPRT